MKLSLGTVQFGMEYGVANRGGQVKPQEVRAILVSAAAHGVDTLDTAIGYGDSEQVLGEIGVGGWRVITKLPALPSDCQRPEPWAVEQLEGSLKRLNVSSIDAVLLHRPDELLGRNGPELLAALERLRTDGLTKKIGVSIYSPEQLDALYALFRFDVVQAPLNVLDDRLLCSGWARRLKDIGVEIHARSVFLQGLLLMNDAARPAKFERWSGIWHSWNRWLQDNGQTALEACLQYVLSIEEIDRVIVGVDTADQFADILAAAGSDFRGRPVWHSPLAAELINPSMWGSF